MANSLSRTGKDIAEVYNRHKDMVYRICFAYMKNTADTEDIIQEAFVRLIKAGTDFTSHEHEKAWLIRTATNLCKNNFKHWWRKRENIEDHANLQAQNEFEIDETFKLIMSLPGKYKTVVYLYYYEGYDSVEISRILSKPQSTVRYLLSNARKALREIIM
ncbi:MAG: RNA polymerase sigma factor [Defluviitaleaceae bacterium]|nr:RNA polymerase sigma factor [Defluviitaleaceae bacterium]